MKTITVADAMWVSAESIVNYAKKCGINIKISDVYNAKNAKQIAFISAAMKALVIEASGEEIEILKD